MLELKGNVKDMKLAAVELTGRNITLSKNREMFYQFKVSDSIKIEDVEALYTTIHDDSTFAEVAYRILSNSQQKILKEQALTELQARLDAEIRASDSRTIAIEELFKERDKLNDTPMTFNVLSETMTPERFQHYKEVRERGITGSIAIYIAMLKYEGHENFVEDLINSRLELRMNLKDKLNSIEMFARAMMINRKVAMELMAQNATSIEAQKEYVEGFEQIQIEVLNKMDVENDALLSLILALIKGKTVKDSDLNAFIDLSSEINNETLREITKITKAGTLDPAMVSNLYNNLSLSYDQNEHKLKFEAPNIKNVMNNYLERLEAEGLASVRESVNEVRRSNGLDELTKDDILLMHYVADSIKGDKQNPNNNPIGIISAHGRLLSYNTNENSHSDEQIVNKLMFATILMFANRDNILPILADFANKEVFLTPGHLMALIVGTRFDNDVDPFLISALYGFDLTVDAM